MELSLELICRPLIAGLLGAVIGLDRAYRAKEAGFRTHFLVCLGSALFMLVSQYGFSDVIQEGVTRFDPGRVAAQVVSGIGSPTIRARADHRSGTMGHLGYRTGYRRWTILAGNSRYGLYLAGVGTADYHFQKNRYTQLLHKILDRTLREHSENHGNDTPTRGTHHLL